MGIVLLFYLGLGGPLLGLIIAIIASIWYVKSPKNNSHYDSYNAGYRDGFIDNEFYTNNYHSHCHTEHTGDYYDERPWCEPYQNEPYAEYHCPDCLDEMDYDSCSHYRDYE